VASRADPGSADTSTESQNKCWSIASVASFAQKRRGSVFNQRLIWEVRAQVVQFKCFECWEGGALFAKCFKQAGRHFRVTLPVHYRRRLESNNVLKDPKLHLNRSAAETSTIAAVTMRLPGPTR